MCGEEELGWAVGEGAQSSTGGDIDEEGEVRHDMGEVVMQIVRVYPPSGNVSGVCSTIHGKDVGVKGC